MKKSISIDIAEQLFMIDEDAWEILKNYLENLRRNLGNDTGAEETIRDIEARIAEIFGGGQEPAVMVTREMVDRMIETMGSPDEYSYSVTSDPSQNRRISPSGNSFSDAFSKSLKNAGRSVGRFFYLIYRAIMIIAGSTLSLLGFLALFSFVVTLFFNGTPLVRDLFEPDIVNIDHLLSMALNIENVLPVIILAAVVVVLPLSALTYLGIIMVFNLRSKSKVAGIVLFTIWLLSVAILGVILSAKLSVYSEHKRSTTRIEIVNKPDTIYLSPSRKLSDLKGCEYGAVEHFTYYKSIEDNTRYGSVQIKFFASDSTGAFIHIDKEALGKSDFEALNNLRNIEYNAGFSGDTLYFDEYYSIKTGENWHGSNVDISIVPEKGTIIKCLPGLDTEILGSRFFSLHPPLLRVCDYGFEEITD